MFFSSNAHFVAITVSFRQIAVNHSQAWRVFEISGLRVNQRLSRIMVTPRFLAVVSTVAEAVVHVLITLRCCMMVVVVTLNNKDINTSGYCRSAEYKDEQQQ